MILCETAWNEAGGCTSMAGSSVVEGKIVVILMPEDWFLETLQEKADLVALF